MITYKGVFAATTKFTLQRAMAGRRAADRLRISGQVPSGTLTAGTYRLRSLFTDANGIRHAF